MQNRVQVLAFDQDYSVLAGSGFGSIVDTSARFNGFFINNSPTTGDNWQYPRYFSKGGLYKIRMVNLKTSDSGIMKVGLDSPQGTNIFSKDLYNASTTYNNVSETL